MQPLIGAIVTAVGAWWGSKRSGEADHGGITQLAETHGAKSPVHQTASLVVNRHTWQVQAREPQPRRLSAPAQSSSSESDDLWWVIILIGIIAIIALTWVLAAFWPTVSTILYVLVLIAIFIAALTWHRWPDGIAGRVAVRTAIVTVGSAVLWAVSVLPQPVRGEPALPTIAASTEGLPFGQALGKTLNLIGMNGLFTYELRLFGLGFLVLALGLVTTKAFGLVIAELGARRADPSQGLIRLGNAMSGRMSVGVGYIVSIVVLTVIGVLALHPTTVGWLVDQVHSSPMTQK